MHVGMMSGMGMDACIHMMLIFFCNRPRDKVCELCMYDTCIYHLRPLTLVHVCFMCICMMHAQYIYDPGPWSWCMHVGMMHVSMIRQILFRTNQPTDKVILGVGCYIGRFPNSYSYPIEEVSLNWVMWGWPDADCWCFDYKTRNCIINPSCHSKFIHTSYCHSTGQSLPKNSMCLLLCAVGPWTQGHVRFSTLDTVS